jgi:hypothetical protein
VRFSSAVRGSSSSRTARAGVRRTRAADPEAAEAYDFVDTLAQEAKKDGDTRPIGQIRSEVYSLLLRGAAVGAQGARADLTITAALEALEGTSTQPGDVNGFAITPAQLAELLRRVGALGLQTPGTAT